MSADQNVQEESQKNNSTQIPPDMYQYQGFWYPSVFGQGVVNCQKHFQVEDSDMFLVTTPKSGTTWLKAIVFTLLNRSQYPVGEHHHPLLTRNPHDLLPYLELLFYAAENETPDMAAIPSPRLFATHIPYISLPECVKSSPSKIVYLSRNPKDVVVSLCLFTNSVRHGEIGSSIGEVVEMFCEGFSPYGPFWDHALTYWNQSKESPDKVFFLKYEDMKEQPGIQLRRLAGFLGCPITAEEEESGLVNKILNLCSFDNLSNLDVNKNGKTQLNLDNKHFFRRGEVGDWKNHLSAEMVEKLDQITNDKFSGSGLVL